MKLLFKNATTYSQHIYDEFLKFHKRTFSFKYNAISLIGFMLILFFIMLYVQNHYYKLAFIFCACLTSFILLRYFHPIEEVRQDYHSDTFTQEQTFTFLFYEKYFKIYTKNEYTVVYYRELYKIFETENFFYLYLDHRHSLLLDKAGFKKCTSIEFREFIKNTYPFKYKLDKIKK